MPPKTDHLEATKLPKEDELRIYMDSLNIESPYRFPEETTRPIQQLLAESSQMVELRDTAAGYIFHDDSLKPNLYNRGNRQRECNTIQHNDDSQWSKKTTAFRTSWNRIEAIAKSTEYGRISCAEQLRSYTHFWTNALRSFKDYQNHRLLDALYEAKLVDTRDDPSLREEIELRKKQYPNQKIYTFLGRDLASYYRGVGINRDLRESILIDANYFTPYNCPGTWAMNTWESAVVAQYQARVNYSFHYDYEIEKIPRWWKIQAWMWTKFNIKVDERRRETEIVNEGPDQPSRFSMIEI